MEDLSKLGEDLDFEALKKMKPDEKILSSIDYTRPLGEYATAYEIADYLRFRERTVHVYTKDLNVNGRVVKEDMSKYLASKDYINSGALKEAQKSPLHLFYETESGWKDRIAAYESRKSYFEFGEFMHQAVLEPSKFKRVIVEPNVSLASIESLKSGIDFWENKIQESDAFDKDLFDSIQRSIDDQGLSLNKRDGLKTYYLLLKASSGYMCVSECDKIRIDIAYSNYRRYGDGLFFELIKHGKREISMYLDDEVKQRIRPDAILFEENTGANIIVSVKTTNAESIGHFAYQSAKLNYELTEGMYCEVASKVTGRDFRGVITIMIQNKPPFGVAALVWNGEDIEVGKYKYYQALQTVFDCRMCSKYPGYDAYAESGNMGLIDMKQPNWNAKELHPVDVEE